MSPKSSAHYQREFRRRLREQGLVKKEVWILPEHASALAAVGKRLRIASEADGQITEEALMTQPDAAAPDHRWTTASLFAALGAEALFRDGRATLRLVDGVEPSIAIEMHEYGDLPLFVTVFGEQTIVDAVMWPVGAVRDVAAFNDTVLRTHKFFPLSTISLDALPDGESYYQMFGALSASARVVTVVLEIETLARNVIQATEAYRDFLVDADAVDAVA